MKKGLLIVTSVMILVLACLYIAGVALFQQHILPRTRVNGRDVSLIRRDALAETYEKAWRDGELTIRGRGGKEDHLKAKDIAYTVKLEKASLPQRTHYWFLESFLWKDNDLKQNVHYDDAALEKKLGSLHVLTDGDIEGPLDAYVGADGTGQFVVFPEREGNRVEKPRLKAAILDALAKGEDTLDLEEKELYDAPNLRQDTPRLVTLAAEYNALKDLHITYDFSDRKEDLSGEALRNLFDPNAEGKLVLSPDKVNAYVEELAKKYDTFRGTRDFAMSGGGVARIAGGIYGWQTNRPATAEALMKALEARQSTTLTPVYSQEAKSRLQNDIGNSYVEIDIARQHMWLYKDGQLVVETPVVTGDVSKGNGTPTGVGRIWSKERNRYLTGADYKSYVHYWMPFNWSGCGLHDSSWRSTYGGRIYRGHGSHGCVNTPPAVMKNFYEHAEQGMPVVVYDSSSQRIS